MHICSKFCEFWAGILHPKYWLPEPEKAETILADTEECRFQSALQLGVFVDSIKPSNLPHGQAAKVCTTLCCVHM